MKPLPKLLREIEEIQRNRRDHDVTAEMLDLSSNGGLEALELAVRDAERIEVYRHEARRSNARFEHAVRHLSSIHALMHPQDVVLPDGRQLSFHPKDELVREAWEGLSAAIRGIPAAIDAAMKEEGR